MVKETLADVLAIKEEKGEAWSYTLGDAAAEVVFRLGDMFPCAVVEGWWRGDRRQRAEEQFVGCVEIFCRCEPSLAERRMRARLGENRHPIHRDVVNPGVVQQAAQLAGTGCSPPRRSSFDRGRYQLRGRLGLADRRGSRRA